MWYVYWALESFQRVRYAFMDLAFDLLHWLLILTLLTLLMFVSIHAFILIIDFSLYMIQHVAPAPAQPPTWDDLPPPHYHIHKARVTHSYNQV